MSHITTSLQLMLPLPISTISPRSMFQPFFRTFHSIFQDRHGETGRPLAQANHAHLDGGQNSWWRFFDDPRGLDGKTKLTILDFLCQAWPRKNSTFIESVSKLTTVDQPKISSTFKDLQMGHGSKLPRFFFATVSQFPHRKTDPPSPATTLWFKVNESSLMDDDAIKKNEEKWCWFKKWRKRYVEHECTC